MSNSFWDSRAGLGLRAGTNDLIAKEIEMRAIGKYVRDGMHVLDVGCGNGITALWLTQGHDIYLRGVDSSGAMIATAWNAVYDQTMPMKGSVEFVIGDMFDMKVLGTEYDLVYTERCLINLPNWVAQRRAFVNIINALNPGGCYVMCENSQEGLDYINDLRHFVGLPVIIPPSHNRYLRDNELKILGTLGARLEAIDDYSGTYYLLSRVVNAWLAAQDGNEPDYNAAVNQLALQLPSLGIRGQGRIWVWRKQ